MSLRLQMFRLKVRVKNSLSNLSNKKKVDNILECVRQKKAQQTGMDISKEEFVPTNSKAQNFKNAFKAKIQANMIIQKIKGFYGKYKDKYLSSPKEEATEATLPKTTLPKLNINPALLAKRAEEKQVSAQHSLQTKLIKDKIANAFKKQEAQMQDLNTQTYCHGENKHHQNLNNQRL